MIAYDVPAADYHADRHMGDLRPPLSCSILKILERQTAAHAWAAHPANPEHVPPTPKDAFDLGTAAHALFLEHGGAAKVTIVPWDDWRTGAARALRDEARGRGMVPLLEKDYDRALSVKDAIEAGLLWIDADPPLFSEGAPEVTVTWEDRGVFCKARFDWLRNDLSAIDDLKTTSQTAAPERVDGSFFSLGYDLQAAFYLRGLRANMDERRADPVFRFLYAETYPPYALAAFTLSARAMEVANARIDFCLDLWRTCLERNEWPAYGPNVRPLDPPAWAEMKMLDRQDRESVG